MRVVLGLAALLFAVACGQQAEDTTTTPDATTELETTAPPAVPAPSVVATEMDARSRIEAAGYTNVTALMQRPDGGWTATATRDGATTTVTVDPQGSVMTTDTTTTTPPATTP